MTSDATFSPDRKYRYTLVRIWDSKKPLVVFIGCNPSVADEIRNDRTVTRCMKYAMDWGFGGLIMLNIFAWRSTDPKGLLVPEDPVGPENDRAIKEACSKAGIIVACWGNPGLLMNRGKDVVSLLKTMVRYRVGQEPPKGQWAPGNPAVLELLHHLGLTKAGQPKHPLYLKGDLKPTRWIP